MAGKKKKAVGQTQAGDLTFDQARGPLPDDLKDLGITEVEWAKAFNAADSTRKSDGTDARRAARNNGTTRSEAIAKLRASIRARQATLAQVNQLGAQINATMVTPASSTADNQQTRQPSGRSVKHTAKKKEAQATSGASGQHEEKREEEKRLKLPLPTEKDWIPAPTLELVRQGTLNLPDGRKIKLWNTSNFPHNENSIRHDLCFPDPRFISSQYWRQTEAAPYGARISFENSSKVLLFDKHGLVVTSPVNWATATANVCAREGKYYFEVKILKNFDGNQANEGNIRFGWARREACVEMNIGANAYSYAIRDVNSDKIHNARRTALASPEHCVQGDVIGLEISLPSEQLHEKIVKGTFNPAVDHDDEGINAIKPAVPIIRERIPVHLKKEARYFRTLDYYPTRTMLDMAKPDVVIAGEPGNDAPAIGPTHPDPTHRTLPGSYIRYYKNGKDMGIMWENLYAFLPPASLPKDSESLPLDNGMAGYYPAISLLRGAAARFNLGPNFDYPPPGYDSPDDEVDMVGGAQTAGQKVQKIHAMSERYSDQIVESVVTDIIDEVANWFDDINEGLASATLIPSAAPVAGPSGTNAEARSDAASQSTQAGPSNQQ